MSILPKYSIAEIERRWLVDPGRLGALLESSWRQLEDRYLHGTQLRLRKVSAHGAEPVFKFCKKYGKSPSMAEPITNLYLTKIEYDVLSQLPAAVVNKRRYAIAGGALDLYEHPHAGLAVFEMEFGSEAQAAAYEPPAFVGAEVTRDARFSGLALAQSA